MKSNQLMELFGVSDIMDLPDAIMEVLLGDIDRRNDVYTRLLKMNGMDVSYDWFQEMYESELAERSQKAQLFTPPEVSKLLAGLAGAPHGGQKIHEPTAGNGGLIIARWWQNCRNVRVWDYSPNAFPVVCWELSRRSIPILLLNLSIRGIVGMVVHGDTLTQQVFQKYRLENKTDNPIGFSDIVKQ